MNIFSCIPAGSAYPFGAGFLPVQQTLNPYTCSPASAWGGQTSWGMNPGVSFAPTPFGPGILPGISAGSAPFIFGQPHIPAYTPAGIPLPRQIFSPFVGHTIPAALPFGGTFVPEWQSAVPPYYPNYPIAQQQLNYPIAQHQLNYPIAQHQLMQPHFSDVSVPFGVSASGFYPQTFGLERQALWNPVNVVNPTLSVNPLPYLSYLQASGMQPGYTAGIGTSTVAPQTAPILH